MPKNLANPKKHEKNKVTPFLNVFKVPDSESEVRIFIKILILKLSNLMTLIVCNCMFLSSNVSRFLRVFSGFQRLLGLRNPWKLFCPIPEAMVPCLEPKRCLIWDLILKGVMPAQSSSFSEFKSILGML